MFSADRILAIRKSKGFSQELLAEQSGVSLRTIQRVAQGETVRWLSTTPGSGLP